MGTRRADAAQLTEDSGARRDWPLVVRRARASDEAAVMDFASQTWDGWDYIPRAWPEWLSSAEGVLLVGCRPDDDRPVAISRVAMLSPTEAWLEGIRVDPQVRGLDVATDLQVAELHWAAAMGANVVRYATGSDNLGSHRLGARHDFKLLVEFVSLWHSQDPDSDPDSPSAYDEDVRTAATAKRRSVLANLGGSGSIATSSDTAELWSWLDAEPSFMAAWRLYERRPWAIQELTAEAFGQHIRAGEVIVVHGEAGRALAVLPGEQEPAEDSSIRLGLLVGEPGAALTLLEEVRTAAGGETPRVRIPRDAPVLVGRDDLFAAAGYRSPNWKLHLLARTIEGVSDLPSVDATRLVLAEQPTR